MVSTRSRHYRRRRRGVAGVFVGVLVGTILFFGTGVLSSDTRSDVVGVVPTDNPVAGEDAATGAGRAGARAYTSDEDATFAPEDLSSEQGGDVVSQLLEPLASEEGSEVQVEQSSEEVTATARRVLERYSSQETCLLASAGYLDLLGQVWGCVVEGPGWVDVCVIEEMADGTSTVRTARLLLK